MDPPWIGMSYDEYEEMLEEQRESEVREKVILNQIREDEKTS